MDWVKGKRCWRTKKPRLEGETAGSELQQIWPSKAQGGQGQQPKGGPWKQRARVTKFLRGFRRNKEPQDDSHQTETSKDFLELVQEGRFLEACQSIWTLEEEGQDCSLQYQAVARSMWEVVQQALEGTGPSKELGLKLREVLATVEWARDQHESWEASAPQEAAGVATWAGQLEKLLRSDAETRVPTLGPKDQPDLYLEKLDKAVRQGLGSPRASRLGTHLWEDYRKHFQEVLLDHLSELTDSCGADLKSCRVLYTWGKTNLFKQLGRETLAEARLTSQEPTVGHLLDPVIFVSWMSQMQGKLVGLIQEELKKCLERVLICDRKKWAQCSHPTFLEVVQLLGESMDAVQPLGLPVTSKVQMMALGTFSEFLKRYQAEAIRFLQQNAVAGAFPEVHVLANCGILRKTWQKLTQRHVPPAHLDVTVRGTIHDIEDHSRDHLLPRVRALCQSLLGGHFGKKDKHLARALQSLWQGLEGCPNVHSTATYERTMQRLHTAIFGEYVQALGAHLRTLEPRKWEGLRLQVETDTRNLHDIFTKHRDLGMANPQEPIMEIFQCSENKSRETVDDWLASFQDRFPGYLSTQDQPRSSADLEEEIEVKGSPCRSSTDLEEEIEVKGSPCRCCY